MSPNPFTSLLHSRKFWLMVLDGVVSLAVFFVGKYANFAIEDVKYAIGVIQPIVALVIAGITVEDAARHLSTRNE